MNTPFFSIIIPVFNRESLISQTLNSVKEQSFKDYEIIIIDDYSSDQSVDVIGSLMKSDDRLKLIQHEKNKGRSAARNTGLKNAKGKWICYLDSDDIYDIHHLREFHELIKNNPSYNLFALNSQILGNEIKASKTEIQKIKFEDVIKKNLFVPNQLCHRKEHRITWHEEISFSEDLLFVRESLLVENILFKNEITSFLRDHSDRSMNTVSKEKFIKDNIFAMIYLLKKHPLIKERTKKQIESHTYLICSNLNYDKGIYSNSNFLRQIFSNRYSYMNRLLFILIGKLIIIYPIKQLYRFFFRYKFINLKNG